MTRKLTNELIDANIVGTGVKRVGEYSGSNRTHTQWGCLKCGNEWPACYSSIQQFHGCPKCRDEKTRLRLTLTNKNIDDHLINTTIIRLSNYINNSTDTLWGCTKCEHRWEISYAAIQQDGCPECARIRRSLSNDILDSRLKGTGIKRIGNYVNSKSKILYGCEEVGCDNEWEARYSGIYMGKGCPRCGGNLPLTNAIIDDRLIGSEIERVGEYPGNSYTKMLFKHLVCDNEWPVRYGSIQSGDGCPKCRASKNEKLVGSILDNNGILFEWQFRVKRSTGYCLRVDYYLPQYETIIEYNGGQHYKPVCFGSKTVEKAASDFEKQKIRDAFIQDHCDNNGIRLIWIDGREYTRSKLKTYMANIIIPSLQFVV